jgi:hypothetical protein
MCTVLSLSALLSVLMWTNALAHSMQVYTSPGTILYSHGHGYQWFNWDCGGRWDQINRDSVTEYSTSSLRFNRFEVYTYNMSGEAFGGVHWVLDGPGSNDTPFYSLFGVKLWPGYTYTIYNGVTVSSSYGNWPASWFQVGSGGDPGVPNCTGTDYVVYNPN